jgi:GNAT superfamily N-acetyltransferase
LKTFHAWHGSKDPILAYGAPDKPDVLHLGSIDQAAMRCGHGYFHLMEVRPDKMRRIKDKGSDKRATITRARRSGMDALVYLNRYEGISTESLEKALERYSNDQIDAFTDAKFRRVFPEARDSYILLNLPKENGKTADGGQPVFRELGCYQGMDSAKAGWVEKVSLRHPGGPKPPAAELSFENWIGKRSPMVIREKFLNAQEIEWIEACEDALIIANFRVDFEAPDVPGLASKELYIEEGLRFISAPNALLVRDAETEELLGGIAKGVVTVFPEARGQGIARALHICAEETRCINLKPTYFSEGGYASRKSAHRALCARALERGDPVAEVNLQEYELDQPADALAL